MTTVLNGTTDRVQLPVDGSGKFTGYKAVTLNSVSIYLPVAVLHDEAGNSIDAATASLSSTGTERGIVTRAAGLTNILDSDSTASGTITATDAVVAAPAGAGATVSGSSTAGSIVSLLCPGGDSAWNVQITGLTSGNLYFEESMDSTNGTDGNWINVNSRRTGIKPTTLSGVATANGLYRGNTSGAKYFRVRSVGTLSGTPAIVIRISSGTGAIFMNADMPTWSSFHLISAATTNATVVKALPGAVTGWFIQNANAAARYVKFHNTASTPTAGSGVVWTIGVPASAAANVFTPGGVYFSAGIAITTTTGITDADTTAVAASDLNINLAYN